MPDTQTHDHNGAQKTDQMVNKTITRRPDQENFNNETKTTTQTPGISSESTVGYISIAKPLSTMVGYRQSLRLSIAPLKPTAVSTMVESPQLGAQKATGSSYRTRDQWQRVGTNTPDSLYLI